MEMRGGVGLCFFTVTFELLWVKEKNVAARKKTSALKLSCDKKRFNTQSYSCG